MPRTAKRIEHPIRVLLYRRRISQRQLAAAIGYAPKTVQAYLSGRYITSPEFARRAAEYLGVPEHKLFDPRRVSQPVDRAS